MQMGKRILIIGCCGAGKSTAAAVLGELLKLPVHHLDQLWWLPGWIEKDRADFDGLLDELLQQDAWIIDGNYQRTLSKRLIYADTVIWLDYPPYLCLYRVMKRILRYNGQTRPDMAEACPERFDRHFLGYVLGFKKEIRPRLLTSLKDFKGTLIHCRYPSQLERIYSGISRNPF